MYPSVKFVQIENAVNYFLQNASKEDKKTAKRCLDMIKFGMDNNKLYHRIYLTKSGTLD